jgi:hypothetical protein
LESVADPECIWILPGEEAIASMESIYRFDISQKTFVIIVSFEQAY